jgi:5'-nucleotidase
MHRSRLPLTVLACLLTGGLAAQDFTLTVLHVNDTHSKFEPSQTRLTLDLDDQLKARPVYVELGGFPQVAEVIDRLRAKEPNPILVHAGDFVQGSLYFTKYNGVADLLFWNRMKPTAATLGNHEFDKGVPFLMSTWLGQTRFSLVDATVDFSRDPDLAGIAPRPLVIKEIGGQKIGFVGATTPETPYISKPGATITFQDPAGPVQKAVDELARQGVNKIILVSHLGYQEDQDLAAKVAGIDIIVGGHSHTLLGDWKAVGLGDKHPYPTVARDKAGDPTLIVQAWEWAKVVGDLKVTFDAAGKVASWTGAPVAVVGASWFRVYDLPNPKGESRRVQFLKGEAGVEVKEYDGKAYAAVPDDLKAHYLAAYGKLDAALGRQPNLVRSAGDPGVSAMLAEFRKGVKELQGTVAAQVGEDMKRTLNQGPGPIIADGMRAKTGAQIAVINAGGIRTDLVQGPLTVAQVYEVIPFGDTLVLVKLKGSEVVEVLEDGVEFALKRDGKASPGAPMVYVSGITFDLDPAKPKGGRVQNARVLDGAASRPLDPAASYSVVVGSFIANGGDLNATLKAARGKMDTGMVDAEALLDYVKGRTLRNPEERIHLLP